MKSSALAASVRQLRDVMAIHGRPDDSDEHLLHTFLAQHEDSAFAVLVRRYGPLVLGVCRRVLQHEQDAEDAFQATFLLLARNAASLRNKNALSSWLHGAAYRLALSAKRSAARRRKYEEQASSRTPADPADELSWREVRAILDEEIAHLPEIYRSVFILCCLENISWGDAARRLGLKEGTVGSRLTVARKRLARRLARRGVALPVVLAALTAATLPAGLMAKTVQTAVADSAVPASLAELVEGATAAMMGSKVKMAAVVLLIVAASGSLAVWYGRASGPPTITTEPPAALADEKPKTAPLPRQDAKSVAIQGHVLDPDGKPAAGVRVYVDPQSPGKKPIATTTTGTDGRFALALHRSRLLDPETKFPLRHVRILATAKGYGLDWQEVSLEESGKETTLRLVKDDVPIQGRILSLEGKPLTGIKVYIKAIEAFPRNDLDHALDARRKGGQISESTEVHFLWYRHHLPDPSLMATTGADGRFRLEGLGRERIVTLNVEGPGIHYSSMQAMTRRVETVRGPYKSSMIYGANFEYLVKPSRLIRGRVREKGTGKPLSGIRIHDMGFTDYVTAEVVTDEQGRYELPGCPKGDKYGVAAHPTEGAPYFGATIVLTDTPGLEPLTADLELVRGIPCEGKVLDGETGQAVPGEISYAPLFPNPNLPENLGIGRVTVAPGSTTAVQVDGTFRCVVLPGYGCLAFRARERNRYQQACVDPSTIKGAGDKEYLFVRSIGIKGGINTLLPQERYQAIRLINPPKDTKKVSENLRVAAARPEHGSVRDAEGKPLNDVRVRGLERGEGWVTLTNDKFIVRAVNPLRPRRLYFLHDARRLIGCVEVKGLETKPLTVHMQAWAGVRGRLLDKEGQPLRKAKVWGSEFVVEEGHTDDQGRFRLDGLVPGLHYHLYFVKAKSSVSDTLRKEFVGKPGEVRDLGDLRVQPTEPEASATDQ